jgi:hypothetical protein
MARKQKIQTFEEHSEVLESNVTQAPEGLKAEPETIEELKSQTIQQAKQKKSLIALLVVMGMIVFVGLIVAATRLAGGEPVDQALSFNNEPQDVMLESVELEDGLTLNIMTYNAVEETLTYTLSGTVPNSCLSENISIMESINDTEVALTVQAEWSDNLYECEEVETEFELSQTTSDINDLTVGNASMLQNKLAINLEYERYPFGTAPEALAVATESEALARLDSCGLTVVFSQGEVGNQETVIRLVQLDESSFTFTNATRSAEKGKVSCVEITDEVEQQQDEAAEGVEEEVVSESNEEVESESESPVQNRETLCNELGFDLQNCFNLESVTKEVVAEDTVYSFTYQDKVVSLTNPDFRALQLLGLTPDVEATVEAVPSTNLESFILPEQLSYTNQYYPDLNIRYDETFTFSTETYESVYNNVLARRIYLLKNDTLLTFDIYPRYVDDCFQGARDAVRVRALQKELGRYRSTDGFSENQFYMSDRGELANDCSYTNFVLQSTLDSNDYNERFEGKMLSYVTITLNGGDEETRQAMDNIVENSTFYTSRN